MASHPIVTSEAPILRKKAKKVREFNSNLHKLLDDMVETMSTANGVGLAAPQIAIDQRIIVVRLPDDEESQERYGDLSGILFEMVNPEIVKASREMVDGIEACLSVPGYFGRVERHVQVTVRGQDRQGKEVRVKAYDWLARVFQHEIDHLEGVLYTERASEIWKEGEVPPSVRAQQEQMEEQNEAQPSTD